MTSLPGKQNDLHGSAPDTHRVALLLIDVINDFEFPRADELFRCALPMAPRIAELKRNARAVNIPVIYVNDNFGQWKSDFRHTVEHCCAGNSRGREISRALRPEVSDYFVLKPKHSGFYQTPLELLLKHLGSERLVLAGVSTNSCILFTANDAYMRDLEVYVPPDCVAACSNQEHESALEEMKLMLKAKLIPSTELDFPSLS